MKKIDDSGETKLVSDILGQILDDAFKQLKRTERSLISPLIKGHELDDQWIERRAKARGLSPEEIERQITAILIKLRRILSGYPVVHTFLNNDGV